MLTLRLKPGRDKSVRAGHPWVFSGSIDSVHGEAMAGETARVEDAAAEFLAWGAWSPQSNIRVRVWSRDEAEQIDADFILRHLETALALRRETLPHTLDPLAGVRLVHGESDGLPGLVIDRYAETAVVQATTPGADRFSGAVARHLVDSGLVRRVYERSDADVRSLEGLAARTGWLSGDGGDPQTVIREHDLIWRVDFGSGQKTGFYLDQRENRQVVSALATGRDVLNCFCYTGGFTLNALQGGARSVLSLDSSADALQLARQNMLENHLEDGWAEWWEVDVFQGLRKLRDQGRSFDLVILDPPKFAPTAAHAEKAARAYKDINLLGCKLLRQGGMLVTFSCSGGVSADLFRKIVSGAAQDAQAEMLVIQQLGAARDHPVSLNFPEGAYLKGLVAWRAA